MEHIVVNIIWAIVGACIGFAVCAYATEAAENDFDTILRDAESEDDYWQVDAGWFKDESEDEQ